MKYSKNANTITNTYLKMMISNLKSLTVFMLASFITHVCLGQQSFAEINLSTNLPKMTPVSPDAASLGKFGQVPVSYYTGIPNISIPLYAISTGDIQVPISLSYHAGGLKVEEMPSWVGLGWALNAGGVITRSQRGLEDETSNSTDRTRTRNLNNGVLSSGARDSLLYDIYHKYADSEADIYYYNFGGVSGKFFFTEDGNIVTGPRTDIKIEYDSGNWRITTGSGVRYYFSAIESSQSEPYTWTDLSGSNNNDAYTANTCWKLTSITDKNNNTVNFIYEGHGLFYKTKITATRNRHIWALAPGVFPEYAYSNNFVTIYGQRLKEIQFPNGKLTFTKSSTTPPEGVQGVYPLTHITVTDTFSTQVKKFRLYSSYASAATSVGGCEDSVTSRLFLDSIKEVSASDEYLPAYKFTYNSEPVPCRLSNAQDHWGYYNGKDNAEFVSYQNVLGGVWLGADKSPDANYAKAGILEKVTYPTGGSSEFAYEGNNYSVYLPAGFDSIARVHLTTLSGSNAAASMNTIDFNGSFNISSGVLNPGGSASISSAFLRAVDNPNYYHYLSAVITGPGGYYHVISTATSQNYETIELPGAGTYFLYVYIETDYPAAPVVDFVWDILNNPYKGNHYYNRPYGGLRIKSVINKTPTAPDEALYYYYSHFDGGTPDTLSSGNFGNAYPEYNYIMYHYDDHATLDASVMVYNSATNYPLLSTNGNPIGYPQVTVLYGPGGSNGKKEYTHTGYGDHADSLNLYFPYPSHNERDWRRGLLTKEITYKRIGATFTPVQKKEIDYAFHSTDTTRKYARSVKIGKWAATALANRFWDLIGLEYAGYYTVAEAYNIRRETVSDYDQLNGSLLNVTKTEFDYNNKNFQEQRKAINSSRGDSIVYLTNYPVDLNATSSAGSGKFLYDMIAKNMVSIPIEQIILRKKASSLNIVSGRVTTYKSAATGIDKQYSLFLAKPLATGSYTSTAVDGSNNLQIDAAYDASVSIDKYYPNGKPAQLHKEYDHNSSFIFGHVGELVLAEVKNADSISVAFTSFEEDGKGNWTYDNAGLSTSEFLTGKKDYQVSYGISKSGLNSSKTYIVSYWSNNGNYTISGGTLFATGATIGAWTYYEHRVTGVTSTSISGSGKIDELRLYPQDALMTSYTYDPLRGITSATDARNIITYYEYDDFSRLKIVRDQNRNIIKKICYTYSGQTTACPN